MPAHPRALPASAAGSVDAFLARDPRQVWALHRETGEPFYLDVGRAKADRPFTKASLRCPYPGCDRKLTTRGGSKRAHFVHMGGTPHPTAPESEFHLAAKAMIAGWLRERVPEGAVVREEETVKQRIDAGDQSEDIHRRPDVLVTGHSGRRIAYEVEYKTWAIESWQKKQADLDAARIPTLWLLGHTRLRVASETAPDRVKVPGLFREIARSGQRVLAINPTTREVGTLLDPWSHEPWAGLGSTAALVVDSLDDCSFDAHVGLLTPTVVQARARAQATVSPPPDLTTAIVPGDRRPSNRGVEWSNRTKAWEHSKVRTEMLDRFVMLPGVLALQIDSETETTALPAHWRSVIHVDFIDPRGAQTRADGRFTAEDVLHALERRGIRRGLVPRSAVERWMRFLQDRLVVAVHTIDGSRDVEYEPTGYSLARADAEWQALKSVKADYAQRLATRRANDDPVRR